MNVSHFYTYYSTHNPECTVAPRMQNCWLRWNAVLPPGMRTPRRFWEDYKWNGSDWDVQARPVASAVHSKLRMEYKKRSFFLWRLWIRRIGVSGVSPTSAPRQPDIRHDAKWGRPRSESLKESSECRCQGDREWPSTSSDDRVQGVKMDSRRAGRAWRIGSRV